MKTLGSSEEEQHVVQQQQEIQQVEQQVIQQEVQQEFQQQVQQEYQQQVQEQVESEPFRLTAPVIVQPLQNVEYSEGASILFECKIKGHYLNIQWLKGHHELVNPFRYKMSYDEVSGMARLFIANVLREDAGDYTCLVSNPMGQAASTALLISLGKLVW